MKQALLQLTMLLYVATAFAGNLNLGVNPPNELITIEGKRYILLTPNSEGNSSMTITANPQDEFDTLEWTFDNADAPEGTHTADPPINVQYGKDRIGTTNAIHFSATRTEGEGEDAETCVTPKKKTATAIIAGIARKTAGESEYKVVISDNGNDELMVGEQVKLTLNVPTITPDSIEWVLPEDTSTPENELFVDYDESTGDLTGVSSLDVTTATIEFYFAKPGDQEVRCKFSVGEEDYEVISSLTVKTPRGYIGTVVPAAPGFDPRGKYRFSPGPTWGQPGAPGLGANTALADGPSYGGKFGIMQVIVDSATTVTDQGGSVSSQKNEKELDGQFPYSGFAELGNSLPVSDAPSVTINSTTTEFEVDDVYRTHILFQSAQQDAKFVAIGYIDWEWHAKGVKSGGVWTFPAGPNNNSHSVPPAGGNVINTSWIHPDID